MDLAWNFAFAIGFTFCGIFYIIFGLKDSRISKQKMKKEKDDEKKEEDEKEDGGGDFSFAASTKNLKSVFDLKNVKEGFKATFRYKRTEAKTLYWTSSFMTESVSNDCMLRKITLFNGRPLLFLSLCKQSLRNSSRLMKLSTQATWLPLLSFRKRSQNKRSAIFILIAALMLDLFGSIARYSLTFLYLGRVFGWGQTEYTNYRVATGSIRIFGQFAIMPILTTRLGFSDTALLPVIIFSNIGK